MKSNKGITLIALVVTIVILIILATISVNMVFGDKGLIAKAKEAKQHQANAVERDKDEIGRLEEEWANMTAEDEVPEDEDIIVNYTISEGQDLWASTVTLNISLKEQTDLTLDQKKQLAAYMLDCSSYEELVTQATAVAGKMEEMGNAGATEQLTSIMSNEEEFVNKIIELAEPFLNYRDINKLESTGLKVISVKTPYNTTLYTNSLTGKVSCTFVKNSPYVFTVQSGDKEVKKTINVNNVRNYDTQAPHDVKIEFEKFDDNAYTLYVENNSGEKKEVSTGMLLQTNNSLSFSTDSDSSGVDPIYCAIRDEEYYKMFTSDYNYSVWKAAGNSGFGAELYIMVQLGTTSRQTKTFSWLLGFSEVGFGIDADYMDYMDYLVEKQMAGEEPSEEEINTKYPKVNYGISGTSGTPFSINITKDANIYINQYGCLTLDMYVEVEIWDEEKKRKVRKKKKIKDVTYEDDLVVWDFDKGEFTTAKPLWIMKTKVAERYNLLKFSDGSILKTIEQHRIFNKEKGEFTYPMTEDTPIGTTTYTAEGKEVTLVSKEVIPEEVEYTNIITEYHMNLFANNILTSCGLNNLYPIEDMKFVKDNREIKGIEEYEGIPEECYYGLRLGERELNMSAEEFAKVVKEYQDIMK